MEVINPNVQLITNFEVMELLRCFKDNKKKFGLKNLATITYETLRFLEAAPCKDQTMDSIIKFLTEIKKYNLTKSEILMMVNEPPVTPLNIQLQVEDSEERLTDVQVEEILKLSKSLLLTEEQEETNEET